MTPAARLAVLESLPLTADERAAVLVQVEQLARAVEALDDFVSPATEPATGFDPLLGGEA
jgi:hypothetical protein